MEAKRRLLGMTLNELKDVAAELNLPAYASKQIADWLYKKRIVSISDMTNLSAANRNTLSDKYIVGMASPSEFMKSVDGTIKYL
ncbi:MAG: 23S rRNA (adenine(2503)-C(2))-methyltransferase RlmN, partial [Parabacteroides sp.]|nr:23S rRNA (adenine(2503)-C(2))-methyltransferase RlmN [Parabacteroides sp.]